MFSMINDKTTIHLKGNFGMLSMVISVPCDNYLVHEEIEATDLHIINFNLNAFANHLS